MEDIIPLLIVIAISIIGAFRSKSKRKNPDNSAPQKEQRSNNDVFDWLENIVDDDESQEENIPYATETSSANNVVENEEPQEIAEEKRHKPSNKYERFSGFITHEEKEQSKEDQRDLVAKNREQNRASIRRSKPKKRHTVYRDFNPKQAIIYSEIINRKYQ